MREIIESQYWTNRCRNIHSSTNFCWYNTGFPTVYIECRCTVF